METTIALAKTMDANMPIPRIEGTIKQLWERKTGSNDKGDWSMQSGILTDSTGEMKFTLSGCPPMPHESGDKVIFRCASGKKGLTGVKLKIDNFKDKNEPVIWVTPSSMILSEEGVQSSPVEPSIQQSPVKTATEARNQINWRFRHNQLANLYWESLETAKEIAHSRGVAKEEVKNIASCLFIQGTREGLDKSMPIDLVWKAKIKPVDPKAPEMPLEDDNIPY